jgi:hypothetical protein
MNESMTTETLQAKLTSVMTDRVARFEVLVSLAAEQQDILVNGKDSELGENVAAHDALLSQLEELERQEDAARDALRGCDPSHPRSKQLDREIDDLTVKVVQLAAGLRKLTETNCLLLKNAAEYVEFSMDIIRQIACDQQAYDRQAGTGQDGAHALVLDAKV